jgi:hypothetical protein
MKNIHLTPTDNYSPLVHSTSKYGGYFLSKYYSPMKHMGDSFQHIYITSDEITGFENNIWVISGTRVWLWQSTMALVFNDKPRKIILTTDQDLIKDGVQAIDDEFLQWFVKNPSCEEVKVELQIKSVQLPQKQLSKNSYDLSFRWIDVTYYKIIIPQEEPKLINNCPKCGLDLVEREGSKPVCHRVDCGGIILSNETLREWELKKEPKQETLEEAIKREYEARKFNSDFPFDPQSFKLGAKWQEERMYSEEDMKNAIEETVLQCNKKAQESYGVLEIDVDYIFEQFKKKGGDK